MSEMKKFNRDFVERTIEILNDCSRYTERDVTLLLNCSLGMVTLPIELEKNKTNKKVKQFKIDCVNKMKELSEVEKNECNDESFFENIRNAIAHLNIEVENSNNKIESIKFKNLEHGNTGKCTLKISIIPSNLKIFMEYVAKEYLDRFC